MITEPLISVIVPVYNVERYLNQCLDSIVGQSYRNLEILVVDDGSTDGSGEMCDRWAERDKRIRVIHQPNGGLSAARNAALDVMQGEMVTMVDSDDVLHPSAIKVMKEALGKSQASIIVGNYTPFDEDGEPAWPQQSDQPSPIRIPQHHALFRIFYQQGLTHSAWGRLYDYTLYGYRQRQSSILGEFSPKRADVLDICEDLEKTMEQRDPKYLKAVRSRLLSAYFNILLLSSQDKASDHQQLQDRCWRGIKRLRWGCLMDKNVRRKNKYGIIASFMGRNVLCSVIGRNYQPRP